MPGWLRLAEASAGLAKLAKCARLAKLAKGARLTGAGVTKLEEGAIDRRACTVAFSRSRGTFTGTTDADLVLSAR